MNGFFDDTNNTEIALITELGSCKAIDHTLHSAFLQSHTTHKRKQWQDRSPRMESIRAFYTPPQSAAQRYPA